MGKQLPAGVAGRNQVIHNIKIRAQRKNRMFSLTLAQCDALFSGVCHYCGAGPSFVNRIYSTPFVYNGIDRVDNDQGYVIGNCVSCCKSCNSIKYNHRITQLIVPGDVFGKLTVVCKTSRRTEADGKVIWECSCSCGNTHYTDSSCLRLDRVRSCGCGPKKLIVTQVREIKKALQRGVSLTTLADQYQVTKQAIYLIRESKNWRWVK